MSARRKMPAKVGAPQGRSANAGGDGHILGEAQRLIAIPKIARKGARPAKSFAVPIERVPDATQSAGQIGRDRHTRNASGGAVHTRRGLLNHADSAAPIPRKRVPRAIEGVPSAAELPEASIAGHTPHETQKLGAGSGIDHSDGDAQYEKVNPAPKPAAERIRDRENAFRRRGVGPTTPRELPDTIAAIQSLHREHRAIQRLRGDMERRIKSDERWFAVRRLRAAGEPLPLGKFPDVTDADRQMVAATRERFFRLRDTIEAERVACQKELLALVKPLPIMEWAKDIKGMGIASVAAIVGLAGDLSMYSNPAKLWKRMGLAVIDGKGQGKRTNAEEAAKHGYSPLRRSEMHVIGECLLRAGGPYADLYRERKLVESAREGVSKIHAHRRALRYIEKRLLRQMWQAWRGANAAADPIVGLLPADELAGQSSTGTHVCRASQDGGQLYRDIQRRSVPVQPIPRKRAPSRAKDIAKSVDLMREAAD